jgi:dTMP kinase
MKSKILKGIFITFEGPEGSGKSTHIKLLGGYLRKKGYSVVLLREPGNTKIGEKIRKILLDPKNKKMCAYSEMLLYMAARSQLIKENILPSLKKGKVVICDRFLDSTRAYQGYALGINLSLINKLGKFVSRDIVPDLTVFLDIETKKGLSRSGRIRDRIEKRPLPFHEKVKRGYLKLVRAEPKRIKIVKVNKDKTITQARIINCIERCLLKR